jgi:diguanylate cyclase (GGDEF)-like protein/PAS domain S-box-containing protein
MADKLGLLICQVLAGEAEAILKEGEFQDIALATYFPHPGRPGTAWDVLDQIIQTQFKDCTQIYLLGDASLEGLEPPPQNLRHCSLIQEADSAYFLINQTVVDKIAGKGGFVINPGWLKHWKYYLGLWGSKGQASELLYSQQSTHLVLLDTGVYPESSTRLKEAADFVGLPAKVLPIGLDFFRLTIKSLMLRWRLNHSQDVSSGPKLRTASPTEPSRLFPPLLDQLTRFKTEGEAIGALLDYCLETFAPRKITYLSLLQGKPRKLYSPSPSSPGDASLGKDLLSNLGQEYSWTETQKGFRLRIRYLDETLGVLEVDELTHPEDREKMLQQLTPLTRLFGLTISTIRLTHLLRREQDKGQEYRDVSQAIFVIINSDQKVILANNRTCEVLGYNPDEVIGRNWFDCFIPERIRSELKENFNNWVAGEVGILEYYEHPVMAKDGTERIIAWHNTILQEEAGRVVASLCYGEDITERKRTEEELQALTLLDDLTGLYNRRGFMNLAEQQLKIADRMKQELLLIFFDLDGMKRINDTYGHQEGDQALNQAAQILRETFRESDIVGRYGGDEFAVLVLESDESKGAIITKRLREITTRHNTQANRLYGLGLSFGMARYDPFKPSPLEELIRRADQEMYRNKKAKIQRP